MRTLIQFLAILPLLAACTPMNHTAEASPLATTLAVSPGSLMPSAKVDRVADTVTLPLHLGHVGGKNVWFVMTDVSDAGKARDLGLVYARSLQAAVNLKSTRTASVDADGNLVFDKGTIDFSPKQSLSPGDAPNFFPPKSFQPGSAGDMDYSPLVKTDGNIVYNAPMIAYDVTAEQIDFCDGGVDHDRVHDKVMKICPRTMEATFKLSRGFADGKEVLYVSFDANNPMPATMESSTYAPATADLGPATETLYAIVNGETGRTNPNRQGFNSALSGEGSPLNILEGLTPSSRGYSPFWDIQAAVWTDTAITRGERKLMTSGEAVESESAKGFLVSPMGGAVKTLGLIVNCPVIGF